MTDDDAPTGRNCPICSAPAVHRFRPFCSKRCADVDLSRWIGGAYAVPVVQLDESDADELKKFIEEKDAF